MRTTAYDTVCYPGHAYRDTHVAHLHSMARWWGVAAADPAAARVLEVGCGDGANLIPMAAAYPHSDFTGIDLAQAPIARGEALARQLGLANMALHAMDLREFAPEPQSVDYVIVHGLYSWVSAPLREALMSLVARALSPHGVAFISYNCYPGCHRRAEVWDMLRFHVDGIDDPTQRLAEARALAKLLRDAQNRPNLQTQALNQELDRVLRREDGGLFHDDLADIHQPFYVHEFCAHAEAHGLQFLAEAELSNMGYTGLSSEARSLLQTLEPLAREQYLDFMRERRFRQTLLCRQDLSPLRAPEVERLRAFHLSSDAMMPAGELTSAEPDDSACLRSLLAALFKAAPRSLPVADLVQALLEAHPAVQTEAQVLRQLLAAVMSGIVRLHASAIALPSEAGQRPRASAVARAQLALDPQAAAVTTLRHDLLALDQAEVRRLLPLLDGSRDRQSLLVDLAGAVTNLTSLDEHLRTLTRFALLEA